MKSNENYSVWDVSSTTPPSTKNEPTKSQPAKVAAEIANPVEPTKAVEQVVEPTDQEVDDEVEYRRLYEVAAASANSDGNVAVPGVEIQVDVPVSPCLNDRLVEPTPAEPTPTEPTLSESSRPEPTQTSPTHAETMQAEPTGQQPTLPDCTQLYRDPSPANAVHEHQATPATQTTPPHHADSHGDKHGPKQPPLMTPVKTSCTSRIHPVTPASPLSPLSPLSDVVQQVAADSVLDVATKRNYTHAEQIRELQN